MGFISVHQFGHEIASDSTANQSRLHSGRPPLPLVQLIVGKLYTYICIYLLVLPDDSALNAEPSHERWDDYEFCDERNEMVGYFKVVLQSYL
jgi:hypothetical protein